MTASMEVIEVSDFLSNEKRLLLSRALSSAGLQRSSRIRKGDSSGWAPLSFAQERFWFLHHLDTSIGHCNTPIAISLKGALVVDALKQALCEIVSRHEILRSIFTVRDGEPAQIVLTQASPKILTADFTELPFHFRESAARRSFKEEALRPFNIASEPCIRFKLARLSEDLHWLLVVAHHIIFDTWSLGVFSRELFGTYEALMQKRPSPLPELEIQYADFARWERTPENQGRLKAQLSYWKDKLRGAQELSPLPLDHPRQGGRGRPGQAEPFCLGDDLVGPLQNLARREGVSVFVVLLAALKILLYRYSGERDVVVSSAVGNRKRPETEPLIGCFINTLLFRMRVEGDPTFREFLRQVREIVLEAHDNEDVPFEQVVAATRPSRNLSYSPFAQVILVFQNADLEVPAGSGLQVSRIELGNRLVAQQDLGIHIRLRGAVMNGIAEYNPDLFEASTIRRMLAHFEGMLRAGLSSPETRISGLEYMSEAERGAAVLVGATAGEKSLQGVTLPGVIERQARMLPHSIAIACDDVHLSYGELDRRADHLASQLLELGLGPEARVAVYLPWAPAMAVAILGILKAGAACVLLGPELTRPRLQAILRDTTASVVVTQPQNLGLFESQKQTVLLLDSGADSSSVAKSVLDRGASPSLESLAFVVQTSGHTGPPKSVMATYGSTCAALCSAWAMKAFTPDDVFLSASPTPAIDSVLELLFPLSIGAKVVLTPEGRIQDGSRLRKILEETDCTALQATPLIWQALLNSGWKGRKGFKAVSTGDVLSPTLCDRLAANGNTVWNIYGSAEAGSHRIFAELEITKKAPIGRPAPGIGCYVLNASQRPVPRGAAGELCIGGENLNRGYFNDPKLTAQRFIPDPFSGKPGARMYRTGDLVEYDDCGQLYFRCRADGVAKIDERVIRLGEVAAALRNSTAVADAAVVAQATPSGKRILAYVTLNEDSPSRASGPPQGVEKELREFLKLHLSTYMLPSEIMAIDALPIGPHGKLERKALPPVESLSGRQATAYRAPSTQTETVLVELWAQVLKVDRIGVDDDFFDLGGDSLKAQRMIAHIEERLKVNVPTQVAFANPTVAQLAIYIDRMRQVVITDEEELARMVDALSDEEVRALLGDVMRLTEPQTA
ncbi:MAG: condensation domain-containing protein [Acidobacteria bacterium]|nr:condensation domain-containing protein [Acidobacteriota bacterium]